jgi:hypothetical protein
MDLSSHLIFYSGKEIEKREFGVAFMADKSLKGSILDFNPVSDRICVVRTKSKLFNITLIIVHAPT